MSVVLIFFATIITIVRLGRGPSPGPGGPAPSSTTASGQTAPPGPAGPAGTAAQGGQPGGSSSSPSSPTPVPAAVSTSPGIVVYPAPVRVEPDAGADAGHSASKGKLPPAQPAPPTQERAAVDAYNRGDVPGALVLYRQLAQQQPDNAAFANTVRILQRKLPAPPQ